MNYQSNLELSNQLEPYRDAIEATIQPYIKIELTSNNKPSCWQSKFGGLPYMPQGFEYPRSHDGAYLHLLAQINFTEVPKLEELPEKGILQFYIANDDLWGLNLENQTLQDKFRVIYFPDIDSSKHNLITDFSFLASEPELTLPIDGCCAVKFNLERSPISPSDYQFNLFDTCDSNDTVDDKFQEYWDHFESAGHKLLGYPCFTQEDPRNYLSEDEPYILLFQIDSDHHLNGCEIMWGDVGIANFFIKRSHLAKLDFTQVLYNWDCG